MEYQQFSALIERIKGSPSALFLGQNYLSSMDGKNRFWDTVNAELYDNKMPVRIKYEELWNQASGGKLHEEDYTRMAQLVSNIPIQWWLRKMLALRWGMVFTSAIEIGRAHV